MNHSKGLCSNSTLLQAADSPREVNSEWQMALEKSMVDSSKGTTYPSFPDIGLWSSSTWDPAAWKLQQHPSDIVVW